MKNKELWDKVYATDPAHTKKVNQRGGFTAIDSYYQIERATELFGPLGIGWGYTADFNFIDGLAIATIQFWYVWDGAKSTPFTVCASNSYLNLAKTHVDEDAAKKALTDAITKALSYLGFSGDVFMGKFDDNKYVQGLNEKKANPNSERAETLAQQVQNHMHAVSDAETYSLCRDAVKPLLDELRALKSPHYKHLAQGMVDLKAAYDA